MNPLELLRELVAIPSATGSEAAIQLYCEAFLSQHDFKTERQFLPDGRFNLLARRGSAESYLLLYAHVDTVKPDPDWQSDPYTLIEQGANYLGLGCSDMKGGLAVILSAAAQTQAPLKIALGVDEEAWSAGAWQLVQSDWCRDLQAVLVPELSIDSEQEVLGIGRRGHIAYNIHFRGPQHHGAIPAGSQPAIEQAAELISQLRRHCPATDGLLIRSIQAQSQGLTLPGSCELGLSYLNQPGRSHAQIEADLLKLLAPYQAVLSPQQRPTPSPEAYALPEDDPWISRVQAQARISLDSDLPTVIGWSVADENVLATLGLPVLSLAPLGGRSHIAGEWINAESLFKVTELYKQLIQEPQTSDGAIS